MLRVVVEFLPTPRSRRNKFRLLSDLRILATWYSEKLLAPSRAQKADVETETSAW